MTTYLIDSYSVRLWSSRPTTNLDPDVPVAGVYLFEGATYRGYVYFHPDGTPLSPPVIDAVAGQVFLSFNLSQLGPSSSCCGRSSRSTSTSSARTTPA